MMKIDNPLDRKLDAQKLAIPADVRDAVIFVADTLDVCWASAQAVFEKRASPEHALAIYSLVAARIPSVSEKRTRRASAAKT